ncbi:MAG: hypothetical protein HYR98_00515, partial [Nitrospirae bacterium]|nr:hypothetical protein [Nitrospirota bacterium]
GDGNRDRAAGASQLRAMGEIDVDPSHRGVVEAHLDRVASGRKRPLRRVPQNDDDSAGWMAGQVPDFDLLAGGGRRWDKKEADNDPEKPAEFRPAAGCRPEEDRG